MNIREQLAMLSRLGQKDLELKELRNKQKVILQEANQAKARAAGAKSKEEELDVERIQWELKRKQNDLEIQTEKTNLRKWEARANQIRGEREYSTLMSEIGAQKRAISDSESQGLEQLEALEKIEKSLKDLHAKREEAEKAYQAEWEKVSTELDSLKKATEEDEVLKKELMQSLPPPILKRYQMIASRRAGIAVAFLEAEVCQACKRTIPPEMCNRIAKGEVLEFCPSCHRILVTKELGESS